MALGELKEKARPAVPRLAEMLSVEKPSDTDAMIRDDVIQTLGRIGPSAAEAVPALVRAMEKPGKYGVRSILETLDRIGSAARAAAPAVCRVLKSGSDNERAAAAQTLGALRASGTETVAALVAALRDPSEHVRLKAVYALDSLGPAAKAAVPELRRLLGEGEIGSAAKSAIEAITMPSK